MGRPPEDDWKNDPAAVEAAKAADEQAEEDSSLRFKFRGREYAITLEDLLDTAFDEQSVLETSLGRPFHEALNWGFSRTQQWAMWIALSRAGQKVQFDELGSVKPSDYEVVAGPTEDPDGE